MTFAGVRPVGDENTAVGTLDQIDASEPRISNSEKVRVMLAHVTGTLPREVIHIETTAMKIDGKEFPAILAWPVVALIDQEPGVGMAAAQRIAAYRKRTAVRSRSRFRPAGASVEVVMVRSTINSSFSMR